MEFALSVVMLLEGWCVCGVWWKVHMSVMSGSMLMCLWCLMEF